MFLFAIAISSLKIFKASDGQALLSFVISVAWLSFLGNDLQRTQCFSPRILSSFIMRHASASKVSHMCVHDLIALWELLIRCAFGPCGCCHFVMGC